MLRYRDPEDRFSKSCYLSYSHCTSANHSISISTGELVSMESETKRDVSLGTTEMSEIT